MERERMCQEDKSSSPQLFLMFAVDRKQLSTERVALDRERLSTARKYVLCWFGFQREGLWSLGELVQAHWDGKTDDLTVRVAFFVSHIVTIV